MLCHKERKVCIIRLFCRILITVAIYRYDSISILSNHGTPWVHAESSHLVSILLRSVYYLALIELIRQMGEQYRWKFHANAQIHTVGLGGDLKICTYSLHPFTSASSNGYDTFVTSKCTLLAAYTICSIVHLFHRLYRSVKIEIHLVLKICIQIL